MPPSVSNNLLLDAIQQLPATAAPALKVLVIPSFHSKSSILVARASDRPFRVEPVFNLDGLVLRRRNIRGKCDQQVAGDALLDGDSRSWILSAVRARSGIDLQL